MHSSSPLAQVTYRLRDLDTAKSESSVSGKTKVTTVVLPRHSKVLVTEISFDKRSR